jgi:hypothetical protein
VNKRIYDKGYHHYPEINDIRRDIVFAYIVPNYHKKNKIFGIF